MTWKLGFMQMRKKCSNYQNRIVQVKGENFRIFKILQEKRIKKRKRWRGDFFMECGIEPIDHHT